MTEEASDSAHSSRWLRGLVLDLRSLALFRVAIGCCLVVDLLLRIPQINAFYTDEGVLPRASLFRLGDPWAASLHFISGEWAVQLALFLIALLFAVGFTAGYRTRLCAAGSWILLVSMHTRNPMVANGGDSVLRVLLFWSIFLPVNGWFSVDRSLNRAAPRLPARHLSPPGVALTFQICAIYWYAFSEKMHPVWLTERSAIYYALNLDLFARPAGKALLQYPDLLHQLTTATLVLEFIGPLLAISPVLTTPLRLLAVGAFVGFHAGLGLTLRLGLFPWICAAGWLALLPGAVWDAIGGRLERAGKWASRAFLPATRLPNLRLSAPAPRETGVLGNLVVLTALSIVTLNLLLGSTRAPGFASTDQSSIRGLFSITGLGQQWRMFAPRPSSEDGWVVIEGVREDGTRVDVWNGGAPSDARPADFGAVYRNVQWLGYFILLWNRRYEPYRIDFGRYLCHNWNERHEGRERVNLILASFMLERTPPEGQPVPPPTKELFLRHTCSDKAADNK